MRRLAPFALVLVAAGCGADSRTELVQPRLPHALAQSLRAQTAAVQAALAAQDGCAARTRAVALQSSVIASIQAGRVPPRFQETLQSAVNELADAITCTPPPAPTPPAHGPHDKGPGHGKHDKHAKQGEGG